MLKPILTIVFLLSACFLFGQNSLGCADTSYRMQFSSPGKEFRFYTHCNTADGGTVLVGNIVNIADSTYELAVLKVSTTGNVVWKSRFPGQENIIVSKLLEQSNGEIALLGYFFSITGNPKIIVIKLSAGGGVLWCNRYYLNNHYDDDDDLHSYSLSEGLNNDLLFTFKGSHYADNNSIFDDDSSYAIVNRITNAGTLQWSKAFVSLSDNNKTNPSGVFLQNGEVYSFGYSDDVNSVCSTGMGSLYAMRLNYNTGNLIQLKTYCHYEPTTGSYLGFGSPERTQYNAVKLFSNRFALFGRFSGYDLYAYSYQVLLDDRLNIVRATQYRMPYSLAFYNNSKITVLPDGTAHLNGALGTSPRLFWAAFDSANRIIRQRKLTVQNSSTPLFGSMSFAYRNAATYNFSTNYTASGNRYSLFTQIQNNDPVIDSCLGSDTAFAASNPIGYTASSWSWRTILDNPVVSSPVVLTAADFIINTEPLCIQTSLCDSLRITGPDTVCSATFVNFTGLKNPDCRKRVLWQLDNALVDSSYQPNDSMLSVRFRPLQSANAVTTELYASAANCTVAKDTAQLVLLPGLRSLPPDTVVCGAVSIRLSPGKWGKNYVWQDGSTDSVFTATDTGRYTVQAQTACGTVFRDTFNITRPTVLLGADKTVCKCDSVTLQATQGFANYQWRSGGNLLSTNGSSLTISPNGTAQYIVAAQTGGGCTVSDTVIVNVLQPPVIHLGGDTTFCTGDSLRLQAPSSFQTWQWNTGGTASFITVYNSGPYWVKAVDGAGCTGSDTLIVGPLYPKPAVSISPRNVVCVGQTDTLRAGSFASYRWSNGSGKTYLPVTDSGRYWLTVTDANGCTASDTVRITKLALPPKNFLPKDTVVCAGDAVELKPSKSFRNYLWGSGASTPSVTVNNAGLYSLRVTDGDGCTGTDSIRLSLKDCPNRIFFPSAFTPNGDGRNDWLKPVVEGRMADYTFTVYNRWGGIVFSTTDYRRGWDGRLGNAPQTTGAFVWLCRYRFAGEEVKMEKGTVMLIR